jgi:hypothetical protein
VGTYDSGVASCDAHADSVVLGRSRRIESEPLPFVLLDRIPNGVCLVGVVRSLETMEGSEMKKLLTLLALAVVATPAAFAQSNDNNGARVGKAGFLLNVKAFAECPDGNFMGSHRHQISIQADYTGVATDNTARVNKIFLGPGTGFLVQDGNACDETGAYINLPVTPANCRNCNSPTPTFREYEVRARVVGKPGGAATMTSCVEMLEIDPVTQAEIATSLCSVGQDNIRVATRNTGGGRLQNQWENVSTELLTVCVDTSGDGVCDDRIGLFDSRGEGYWWNFDTAGQPHLQLVFLAVPPSQSGGGNFSGN